MVSLAKKAESKKAPLTTSYISRTLLLHIYLCLVPANAVHVRLKKLKKLKLYDALINNTKHFGIHQRL